VLSRLPLHPFAFTAYAVLFVYAANLGEVLPVDLVAPLGRGLIWAGALVAVATLFLFDPRRGALVATAVVVAFAFFGHLAPDLARLGLDERSQLVLWAAIVVGVAVFALADRWVPRVRGALDTTTAALNVFSLVLVAMTLSTILPYEAGRAARRPADVPPLDETPIVGTRVPERDIFYLVFDRYGSDWSLNARYGIDSDLPEWLASQGFEVEPGARSNYRATDFSLASTLTMDFLDHLTERIGPVSSDRTPARDLLKRHDVGRFLRANGYRYVHIGSWYGPTYGNEIADEVLQWGVDSEFDQVLRDASIVPAIERLGTPPEASTESEHRQRHRGFADYQFRQVLRYADAPGRDFVFGHILLPHNPYVFDAEGNPVSEEEATTRPEAELFGEQLIYTNARIRELVTTLLDGPDETDPIVIIQADEGPFLCGDIDCIDGTPETYGIRLGVLGAYYLPGLGDDVIPPDHSSVNTFRTILREYFGADLPRLPDRSFSWPDNEHLYDFQDVTDVLPLPGS
jgi:hypothetical protein